MLQIENLTFSPSQSDFRLNVPQWSCSAAERIAIVGRSGSGKTTFLKLLAGLLQPETGSIEWRGKRVKGADERLVPGHDTIKLVQQDFGQDPHLKVIENLRKYILSHDDDERAERIGAWLDRLEISELGQRQARHLSGGQLQRVALAQTLLASPEVMLMDEPFSNLDPLLKNEFIPALRALFAEEEVTLITVMHDPMDALRMANRIVVFHDGEIIEDGNGEDLYLRPQKMETVRLFGMANSLSDAQAKAWFENPDRLHKTEGIYWFRPYEMTTENLIVPFEIERSFPKDGKRWSEVSIDGTPLIFSS